MRSSKSRSRGNKNRNRSSGNNHGNTQNRVFDSSGPEGKVRGTPQQIIDKYTQLARDAALSNDRVAAENFQQHAEHYSRLLSEAQREAEARREQHEAQQRERQQKRDAERNMRNERQQQEARAPIAAPPADPAFEPQPELANVQEPIEAENGLVETPENNPAPRKRAPRKPRAKREVSPTAQGDVSVAENATE